MQFFILLMGALVFVFYQFQPNTPVFFNQVEWQRYADGPDGAKFKALEAKHATLHTDKQEKLRVWLAARSGADQTGEPAARTAARSGQSRRR